MEAKIGGSFKAVKLPEPTTTVARCYSMIDLGTSMNMFQGKPQGMTRKVFITLELPQLKAVFNEEKGLEPFVVSEEFALSTTEKSNLYKFVKSWRGKAFTSAEQKGWDPTTMIGKTALVQLVHKTKGKFAKEQITEITNENTNLKIGGIMSRPKEMAMPEQINPTFIWDWDLISSGKEPFSMEKWNKIPNFLKEKIKLSEEFKAYATQDLGGDPTAEKGNSPAPKVADPSVSEDGW